MKITAFAKSPGKGRSRRLVLLFLLYIILPAGTSRLSADEPSPLPAIQRMDSRDPTFKQFLLDVETSRRILFTARQTPLDLAMTERIASFLTIYTYTPTEKDELLSIAARCNIPYATLASLNRFTHMEDLTSEKLLLIPSVPGIFIPESPETDLEKLLYSSRISSTTGAWRQEGLVLSIPREGKTDKYRFIPGDDFTPTERVFFLNRDFHFPLQNFKVTSLYGPRTNPVTGRFGIHQGIDLAAPEGSPVYSVKSGTVIDLGEDSILGNYVIISHDNKWVSLYGHLSSITTTLHASLQSGNLIGRVGSTGQSTGPHLHFELRQNGQSRDPARILRLFKAGQ